LGLPQEYAYSYSPRRVAGLTHEGKGRFNPCFPSFQAGLIALNAGLINHALANGLLNGIACAEFYWTVALLFSLSGSALPVGIYHHLMCAAGD